MKNTTYYISTLLLLSALSCGPKKKNIKAPVGEVDIELPCSNFSADRKFFRVTALGESIDMNIAKRKALSNARTQMAGEISTTMKVVGDNYIKSSEADNIEEALERFEENSRTVIKQELTGTKSVCERVTKNSKTGKYTFYVAIELSAQDLVSKYNETLSKDKKLQIDYNYEKFKDTFEKEMEKMK